MVPSKDPHPISITKILLQSMHNGNHTTTTTTINDQSNAEWTKNGPKKRRNALAKKIGDIISSACHGKTQPKDMLCDQVDLIQLDRIENDEKRSCRVAKTLSGILKKGFGFDFKKWETVKTSSASTNAMGNQGSGHGRITRANPGLKIAETGHGRNMRTNPGLKIAETTTQHETEELELCKKRILMGGKCRPLTPSGALHYDKQGILLPEDFLPTQEES